MLTDIERKKLTMLMRSEIIPAIGCTEPTAVALCTARATEVLGQKPEHITAYLSGNVIKNAMGVGIPGTGMIGLPIAIALGALIGKSEYQLEVLKDLKPEDVERGKQFIDEKRIDIKLKSDVADKLYMEVHCVAGNEKAIAVIRGNHTFFSFVSKNGKVLEEKKYVNSDQEDDSIELTFEKVYDYSMNTPIEELEFIIEAAEMNRRASLESQKKLFRHNVSRNVLSERGKQLFGTNPHSYMLAMTAGACDVRMDGAMVPVMSNTGSGNQGISATLPVLAYAEEINAPREKLIRALIISSLGMIYIKQHLGRLSALCGCVIASSGASCGITYLMGGNYKQIVYAAQNMIATLTGMVCDGAKPSCALKLSVGVSTATLSALLAMSNEGANSQEGIVDENIDKTIRNLARVAVEGMPKTDEVILDIMVNK